MSDRDVGALRERALAIAQRLDDELLNATPPASAFAHALTRLLEGASDTMRELAAIVAPNAVASADAHRLTIYGMPRTKKTSSRIGTDAKGKQHIFPAKDWHRWMRQAPIQFQTTRPLRPLAQLFNCRALFYLSARQHGDAVGYYQGLADFLQDRQIVVNDRQLVRWDGSDLRKDPARPRVEVTLTPIPLSL